MTETKPYRPSNGMEGECFMERFCCRCKRDAKFQETLEADDGCPIVANTFVYDVTDPKYPKEWVYNVGDVYRRTARCTAFEPMTNSYTERGT